MSKQEITQPAFRLKQGSAPKVGQRSDGSIGYDVLCDAKKSEVFLALTSNSAGGYFSREPVGLSSIEACLKSSKKDQPLPSKALRAAFVGKSANNGGFLAAVLRHEGLLKAVPDAVHQHLMVEPARFADWKAGMLHLPAEPYVPASAQAGVTNEPSNDAGSATVKRKPRKESDAARQRPDAEGSGEAGGEHAQADE